MGRLDAKMDSRDQALNGQEEPSYVSTSADVQATQAEEIRLKQAFQLRVVKPAAKEVSLIDALITKDQQTIESVLQRLESETDVEVAGISVFKIPQLLQSVKEGVCNQPQNSHIYLKWLRSLLKTYPSSALTGTNLVIVQAIRSRLQTKIPNIQQLSKLKGKLDIVVPQGDSNQHPANRATRRASRHPQETEMEEECD